MALNGYLLLYLMCFVLHSTFACNKYFGAYYGSKKFPGSSCANIVKQRCNIPKNGIYWISLAGRSKPFPVFCDMEAGGWTMVFKVVAGVAGRPATIWNMPLSTYEYSLEALNVNNNFKHHYKNRIVQHWRLFRPNEARVVLYSQRREKLALGFNALKSDKKSWFSKANLLESPWQDVLTEPRNYFVIHGWTRGKTGRDFHINRNYGGCKADDGWLSVGDSTACKWESRLPTGVKVIYSNGATHTNYNKYNKISTAEVFAVFLR